MARVHRRTGVLQDVWEQVSFISRRSPASASRFLDAFEATVLMLAENPHLGARCRFESRAMSSLGLRHWPGKGFPRQWIYYLPLADGIEVVRVLHTSRDVQALLEVDLA